MRFFFTVFVEPISFDTLLPYKQQQEQQQEQRQEQQEQQEEQRQEQQEQQEEEQEEAGTGSARVSPP